jgi:large subunit ribosomal protein L15
MLIHELEKSKGYKRGKVRLWRWNGSGKWNYSTRWLKWQKARSGGAKPNWFEWWQTPLLRRIPKLKGFKRYYKLVDNFQVVNLGRLNNLEAWTVVNKELLKKLRLIHDENWLVKILAKGDLNVALKFEGIDAFSQSAREKIIAAKGEIIEE